jgi:trehalose 6-phosphate synthase
MSRLVVLSNRMPLGENPSGGLVVALGDQLTSRGGLWIGHNDEIAEGTPADRLIEIPGGPFQRKGFDLTAAEYDGYYLGFANSVLWPLFHGRADLLDLQLDFLSTYRAVNRRIARLVSQELGPEDRLWVHDYHLFPIALELRAMGHENPIGFFLHIPFPSAGDCHALPDVPLFARWLAAYDLIGLQSDRDVQAFRDCFGSVDGAEVRTDGTAQFEGQRVQVGAYPIGIDARGFQKTAEMHGLDAGATPVPGEHLIVGVDRLDYSKGLPQRFRAFGHLLDRRPDLAGKVSLLQIAPPTREEVKAYQDIRDELERLSGHINGQHADIDWTPIRYIHRAVPRERLAGIYRAAMIGLVTPLADGMNLVAKEYVAAQNPEDPGVLILSKFAGAAEQLEEALIVNPHNPDEMAQAIVTALSMPRSERRRRHAEMMKRLLTHDVAWWGNAFLAALDAAAATPRRPALRAV